MIYTYTPLLNGRAARPSRGGEQVSPDTHEVYWPHGYLAGSYTTYEEARGKLIELAQDLPHAASDWVVPGSGDSTSESEG